MRCTLRLVLLLAPALLANAASPRPQSGNEGSPALVHIFDPPPQKPKNHSPPAPKKNPPSNPSPGEPAEEEPESDSYDALTDILDALMSILSLEAAATTTISSAGALATGFIEPMDALPCLDVYDLFDSCASPAFYSNIAAATTQACDDTCAAQTSSSDAAAATIQSSCLCYESQDQGTSSYAPDVFNGNLSSCNDYVQAQTQLAAQGLAVTTAFCKSASYTNVSPTTTTMSITPPVSTSTSSSTSQVSSFPTSAGTVLSPAIMSSGSWHVVWWTVIVLVGSGWAAYS